MKKLLLLIGCSVTLLHGCEECPAAPVGTSSTSSHHFASIPAALCVAAIIGEAGNQPFATQVLVARAIRNRCEPHGPGLTGVYGVNNPVVKQASAKVRATALRAWRAGTTSTSFPYKYFGCESDRAYFARIGLHPVLKSGSITFYGDAVRTTSTSSHKTKLGTRWKASLPINP
jgi:hypothetical protein